MQSHPAIVVLCFLLTTSGSFVSFELFKLPDRPCEVVLRDRYYLEQYRKIFKEYFVANLDEYYDAYPDAYPDGADEYSDAYSNGDCVEYGVRLALRVPYPSPTTLDRIVGESRLLTNGFTKLTCPRSNVLEEITNKIIKILQEKYKHTCKLVEENENIRLNVDITDCENVKMLWEAFVEAFTNIASDHNFIYRPLKVTRGHNHFRHNNNSEF